MFSMGEFIHRGRLLADSRETVEIQFRARTLIRHGEPRRVPPLADAVAADAVNGPVSPLTDAGGKGSASM